MVGDHMGIPRTVVFLFVLSLPQSLLTLLLVMMILIHRSSVQHVPALKQTPDPKPFPHSTSGHQPRYTQNLSRLSFSIPLYN
jgi:hypothetical protein